MLAEQKAVQDLPFNKRNSFGVDQKIPRNIGFSETLGGSNISNQCYKVFFSPNREGYARLGIIASKKLMHKAVERNQNKRCIREIFRSHAIKLQHLDLVVMVRRTEVKITENQRQNLAELFNRLELKCAQR